MRSRRAFFIWPKGVTLTLLSKLIVAVAVVVPILLLCHMLTKWNRESQLTTFCDQADQILQADPSQVDAQKARDLADQCRELTSKHPAYTPALEAKIDQLIAMATTADEFQARRKAEEERIQQLEDQKRKEAEARQHQFAGVKGDLDVEIARLESTVNRDEAFVTAASNFVEKVLDLKPLYPEAGQTLDSLRERVLKFRVTCPDCLGNKVARSPCPDCSGTGAKKCPDCEGRGKIKTGHWPRASEQTCKKCQGSGEVSCAKSVPKAPVTCDKCKGKKQMKCPSCGGSGKVKDNSGCGGPPPCPTCKGKKEVDCDGCGGKGIIPQLCPRCNGSGQITFGQIL